MGQMDFIYFSSTSLMPQLGNYHGYKLRCSTVASEMLDFEVMVKMAKDEPEALEAWLREQIEELISSAKPEHQHRLRGLQFTIDMHRRKASNPMSACLQLSRMMHESFEEMREAMLDLTSPVETQPTDPVEPIAAVIPFGRK